MILSGKEILKEMENGNIKITPFNMDQLNPNSYNLTLGDELMIYDANYIDFKVYTDTDNPESGIRVHYFGTEPIDMKKENPTVKVKIPEETGYVLYPGIIYLAKTVEVTETHKYLPCLEGRSSIGRLGIDIHATAGFGDVGFIGAWVLEISCKQPVRIYPNTQICQIYYQEVKGEVEEYHGKYQNQNDIVASKMYKDLEK